ncbi:MAG: hypothetical protein ACW99A_04245 [Candidatus Kariarchaeaceae archaeon]
MNVFTNIISIFKKPETTKATNVNFYVFASTLISITLGIFAYAIYKVNELDLSNLKFPY